jgi:hypothetical protein
MITVKLLGGMGNQMFQMAFGLALKKRGYQVQFDKSALVERTHREYSLGIFADLPFGCVDKCIYEKRMLFNPEYLSPPDSVMMVGYWQTEKYFEDIAQDVRDAFEFKTPYSMRNGPPELSETWDKIYRSRSVAIHVRRQDYVNLQHFHGMPTIGYYRYATKLIRDKHYDPTFFVFSDDIQWCRENFPQDFTFVSGTDKYEDLRLMSSCKHIITANSSFSWWAAWLGDNQVGRTVVAPARWFADETAEAGAADIVPARWNRL